MTLNQPTPPDGVINVHRHPTSLSDGALVSIHEDLQSGLTDDLYKRLTEFIEASSLPDKTPDYRDQVLKYLEDSIAYRDSIRPNGLRGLGDLPDMIGRTTTGGWVHYHNGHDVDHDIDENEADTVESGKYLFFSPDDTQALEDIIVEQFAERPFPHAKISTIPAKKQDWVLCLYQDDNRYWFPLRSAYHDPTTVRFRGFKTNEATRKNEYSDKSRQST
jgi:hypothetical protein